MSIMQLEENPIDVINAVINAKIMDASFEVVSTVVLNYLSEYSTLPEGITRVDHFKRYITGDLARDY